MFSKRVEQYSVERNQWHSLPDLKVPVYGVGAAVVDDELYCVAGADHNSYLSHVWVSLGLSKYMYMYI